MERLTRDGREAAPLARAPWLVAAPTLRTERPRRAVGDAMAAASMIRLAVSLALFSAWLVLLLWGSPLGAAVYGLLVAALAIFPWRLLRFDDDERA